MSGYAAAPIRAPARLRNAWRALGDTEQYAPQERPVDTESVYVCCRCDEPLFATRSLLTQKGKWISFDASVCPEALAFTSDTGHGLERTSISCGACGVALGHAFADGPTKTGRRYCVDPNAVECRIGL